MNKITLTHYLDNSCTSQPFTTLTDALAFAKATTKGTVTIYRDSTSRLLAKFENGKRQEIVG